MIERPAERPPTAAEEAAYDEFTDRAEGREPDTETQHSKRSAFSKLENKLAKKKNKKGGKAIKNPGGLAYTIGKAKYGAAGMAKKAAAGKAKAAAK